ncbi:MAG: hypothetical protein R3280_07600 [Marinobacter sp.]|nr:hypothetical protein [Marinobacter sp.]MDX1634483.1 hypothetical protein [Marinobacter sp.]
MTELLVNAMGLILMAAIVGWFWLSDSDSASARISNKGSDSDS